MKKDLLLYENVIFIREMYLARVYKSFLLLFFFLFLLLLLRISGGLASHSGELTSQRL